MGATVIVQAGGGLSALPDRELVSLGGRTALSCTLERARRIPGAELVVCAVPDDREHDLVAEEAADCAVMVVRGPAADPLGLVSQAAREAGADTVVRITSQCPVIDPIIAGGVLGLLTDANADYASNTMPAKFPHGLDCEAFSALLLDEADRKADTLAERRSVTGWMRRHPGLTRANLTGPGGGLEHLRWTLETPEDAAFLQALFSELGSKALTATAAEMAALCLRRPDLSELNADRVDYARLVSPERASVETRPMRFPFAA
ncbi:glycosyltransferase family protein [Oceanicaulis sp. LC35]|uniref:glycosyltransferase family protein n=1 Tax=Oceanicaulis sp. LC35 TaxID=3349635 RepID=UPI003F830DE1